MRKILNVFALSLLLAVSSAAISPVDATVTTQTTAALAADSWVSLGAGPWILSSRSGTAQFAISDSTPSLSSTTFFITPDSPSISIQTISNVWVKSSTSAKPAYVTYAPISNGTVTISSGSATIGAVTQSGVWTTGRTWSLASAGDSVSIGGTLPAFSSTPTVNVGTMPPVAVTGTFWQTTQPVSLASLPALAAGSATIGKVDQGAPNATPWNSNITQLGGVAVSTGAGTTDSGTQRITVATDSPTAPFATTSIGSLQRYTDASGNYTANTGWNNSNAAAYFTFANACRVNGGTVLVPEIDVYSSANPATKLQGILWLFNAIPGTVIADNAAFTIAAADFANVTGPMQGIAFTLGNTQASGAANSAAAIVGTTYAARCAAAATSIYGMVQVVNAYAKAASETLTIKLRTIGVN